MRRMKNRRGAIMLMAAFIMVMMLIMLAFLVDLSRMFVQKNELQTGTDAGAIAGALKLSTTTANVSDSAIATANRNKVLGTLPSFVTGQVMCGVWDGFPINGATPDAWHAGSPHALPCVAADNAVQLSGNDTTRYLFPGIMHAVAKQVPTVAVAWVAPTVDATSCIKPLAVDYQILLNLLDPLRGGVARNPLRVLDGVDYNILHTQSALLTFCLKDGSQGSQNCPNTANPPGSFNIIGLMPADRGGNDYGNELGSNCSETYPIGQGDNVDVQTGNIVGKTKQGVAAYCTLGPAPCVMKFVFYDNPVTNPSATYPTDKPATDGAACQGQTTGTGVCYKVVTIGAAVIDYPPLRGTPPGVITGHFTIGNDPQGAIGTRPGLLQRVILVQ